MNATNRADVLERFWSKVNKTATCWLWMCGTNGEGYGRFHVDGSACAAHRFSYELLVGPIPADKQLDHLCRVRNCVNPAHIEPVTQRENVLRGGANAAANARKTHCKRGHELSGDNLYVCPGRYQRCCRICARAHSRDMCAKRRAERASRQT